LTTVLLAGITKFPKSLAVLKKKTLSRVPLRELSDQEVFERDEAVLGDLRRRRSGEHGVFEVESVLAQPSPNTARATSISSSSGTSTSSGSTAPTEVSDENDGKKFRVLKRSDSEEELRKKINQILENTTKHNPASNPAAKRKTTRSTRLSPMKPQHPAIRQVSPSIASSPGAVYSVGSPFSSPLKLPNPTESPLRILRSPSPIVKPAPARVGLGMKAVNAVLAEKKDIVISEKKKIVVSASVSVTKKKAVTKKAGSSSLRRAAGVAGELRKMR
jgi:hypothetical protein